MTSCKLRRCCLIWAVAIGPSLGCSSSPRPTVQADAGAEVVHTPWRPGMVYPSHPGPRGLLDRRGPIHAHSVYSHDACDNAPRDPATGAIDPVCFEDFRRDLCQSKHDFVMLTDHDRSFSDTEFPEALLYRPERGDRLVERNGTAVANFAGCPGGGRTLILAGCEAGTMPVGITAHVAPTPPERSAIYSAATAEAVALLKAAGAVTLVAHTEDWTAQKLVELGVDGFEMYNLHANMLLNPVAALTLLGKLAAPETLPHSDLVLLPLISEDPRYLDTWAAVLGRGRHAVTTLGTDCHRNTFQQALPDGERVDSYRRMMIWFSNHLLLRPEADGTWDDRHLKEALGHGRLYGAFEVFGFAQNFDFRGTEGDTIHEMGEPVSLARGARLKVSSPTVQGLDTHDEAPVITARVLLARGAAWESVAETDARELDFAPTEPGAYRAEIRIRPTHLRAHLASYANLADKDFVWIYANPIYVVD